MSNITLSKSVGPSGRPILGLKTAPKPEASIGVQDARKEAGAARGTLPSKDASTAKGKPFERALEWMRERWPLSVALVRPLAVGAGPIMVAQAVEAGHSRTASTRAMKAIVTGKAYRAAVAAPGAMRVTLEGEVVEPVSEEHRAHAAKILRGRRQAEPLHFAGHKPGGLAEQALAVLHSSEPPRDYAEENRRIIAARARKKQAAVD